MDSDDIVVIESGPSPNNNNNISHPCVQAVYDDTESEEESEIDPRPIIHTNTMMRNGKYRYHNYLRETNDNCPFCHDFLLQAYRERYSTESPFSAMVTPVGCVFDADVDVLNESTASATTADADASLFIRRSNLQSARDRCLHNIADAH
jgi:hypothetical protein